MGVRRLVLRLVWLKVLSSKEEPSSRIVVVLYCGYQGHQAVSMPQ